VKVVFDHINGFGKVSEVDFIYSNPKGIPTENTPVTYLEKGWVEWGDYWYNLRSVRLNVNEYTPSKTTKRLSNKIQTELVKLTKDNLSVINSIYNKYVEYHNYVRDINISDFLGMDMLTYLYEGKIIGGLIYKIYKEEDKTAMASYQFLWDYKKPSLSLGKVSQLKEIEVAKYFDCKHLYLMGGYESVSSYKGDFKGFEWFTGGGWSDDTYIYKRLCERDDEKKIL